MSPIKRECCISDFDKSLPNSEVDEFRQLMTTKDCRWCGTNLAREPIRYYPHEAGWVVKCLATKVWLYIHCPKCHYDWALWKLGVPRMSDTDQ